MSTPLISLEKLHFRYPGARADALSDLDLQIAEGEFVAVVGANGSGKSTLARIVGGLQKPGVAHRALACGHDLLVEEGRLAARRNVGVLFQNPENQLVAERVEDDIAFGLENLAWPPRDIRRRVDEMLGKMSLKDLRLREPHLLSGGQKQRTALAGVLAVPRRALVLDEPTAMLDPAGREEVLGAVQALRREGLAVVYITQEMDEVVGADRIVALERGSEVYEGEVAGLFADVELVRRLGLGLPQAGEVALALTAHGRHLAHLPLTLDELVEELRPPSVVAQAPTAGPSDVALDLSRDKPPAAPTRPPGGSAEAGMSLSCREVAFSYEEARAPIAALRGVTVDVAAGGSLGLLGASGAGKSTLLQVIRGLDEAEKGTVLLDGAGPESASYGDLRRRVGLVFQAPELQLFAATAREDVAFGPRRLGWPESEVEAAVDAALELVRLPPEEFGERHPYSLSGGEQRRLALAGVLAMRPRLLLLDEPFVSLDPGTRRQLVAILGDLKAEGVSLVLATHDVDLAWALCDELLVLAEGRAAAAGAWDFAAGGRLLAANRLREPFLVQLWRRLGREPHTAPRSAAAAAEALS